MSVSVVSQIKIENVRHEQTAEQYKLKLKLNLTNPFKSKAKLIERNGRVHSLASKSIIWEGIKDIPAKKISKLIEKAAAENTLSVKVKGNFEALLELHIVLNRKQYSQSSPISLNSQSSSISLNILSVQGAQDFIKFYQTAEKQQFQDFMQRMAQGLVRRRLVTTSDLEEVSLFFDFLDLLQQQLIVKKISNGSNLNQIVAILKFLHKEEAQQALFKSILSDICLYLKPFFNAGITEQSFDQKLALFEYLPLNDKESFIEDLIKLSQETFETKTFISIEQAFRDLLYICYRLHSNQQLAEKQVSSSTSAPLSKAFLSLSKAIELIYFQIHNLENKILTSFATTCYLTSIVTLMQITVLFNNVTWDENEDFDEIYKKLNQYKTKAWLQKKVVGYNNVYYTVNFLAKYAKKMLTVRRDDPLSAAMGSSKELVKCPNLSPQVLGVGLHPIQEVCTSIPSEDVKRGPFSKGKKTETFVILKEYSTQYLEVFLPARMQLFYQFVDALIDQDASEKNKMELPTHNTRFFVIGLIEFLRAMYGTHATSENKIGKHVVKLLSFIQNHNSEDSTFQKNPVLFRVQPDKVDSTVRASIRDKIKGLSIFIESKRSIVEESGTSKASAPSLLFRTVFEETFPWLESLRQQLKKLKSDKTLAKVRQTLTEIQDNRLLELEKILQSDSKVVVVMGNAGAGKSSLLKNCVQTRLENYQIGHPMPFYISLSSIRVPNGKLMEEALKQHGVFEYQSIIKRQPTLWFLDAFDEIPKKKSFNIFKTNCLDQWTNAQFVFACRSGFIDKSVEFAPPNRRFEILALDTQLNSDLDHYLSKFNPHSQYFPDWTPQRYKESIQALGLMDFCRDPFYLDLIVDCLPVIASNGVLTDAKVLRSLYKRLVEEIVKKMIERECEKSRESVHRVYKPAQYLDFTLKVSELMRICQRRSIPQQLQHTEFLSKISEIRKREETLHTKKLNTEKQIFSIKEQLTLLTESLQTNLDKIEEELEKTRQESNAIQAKQNAEVELHDYLFSEKHATLGRVFFITSSSGEREFVHSFFYDYFQEIINDTPAQNRLRKSLKFEEAGNLPEATITRLTLNKKLQPSDLNTLEEIEDENPSEPRPDCVLTMATPQQLTKFMRETKHSYDLFLAIMKQMAESFSGRSSVPSVSDCEQIESVFEYLPNEHKVLVIQKLVDYLDSLHSLQVSKSLASIFNRLLISSYSPNAKNSLHAFSKVQLVYLVNLFMKKIKKSTDDSALAFYWASAKTLLEVMWCLEFKGLDRATHFAPFRKIAKNQSKRYVTRSDKPLVVKCLAEQFLQYLVAIGDNETAVGCGLRHFTSGMKVLGQIADKISVSEPWYILGLFNDDFVTQLKGAFSKDATQKKWFWRLMTLKQAYLNPIDSNLQQSMKGDFLNLVKSCLEDSIDAKSRLGESDKPYLILGLIDLLQNMVSLYAEKDNEIALKALELLAKIKRDNLPQANKHLYFNVEEASQAAIMRELESVFLSFADHAETRVRTEATKHLTQPLSLVVKGHSNLLLDSIVTRAPWMKAMNQLYDYLNKLAYCRQKKYFIPPRGRLATGEVGTVEQLLGNELSNDTNKSILLSGPSGSGKTLFLKHIVLKSLDSWNESKPIIFYVNLTELKDPRHNLVKEILTQYQLQDRLNQLKQLKSVWFCDGYDELFLANGSSPFNIYAENHLEAWPNAHFVFACRDRVLGTYGIDCFAPSNRVDEAKVINLEPFNGSEIKEFLAKFTKASLKTTDESLAKIRSEESYQYLVQEGLGARITNPFSLSIFSHLLEKNGRLVQMDWNDLFGEWFYIRIEEEYNRLRHNVSFPKVMAVSYLDFAVEIFRCMEICQIVEVNLNRISDLEKVARRYIEVETHHMKTLLVANPDHERSDVKRCELNIAFAQQAPSKLMHLFALSGEEVSLARGASLVLSRDGIIEYEHPEIYKYVQSLSADENAYGKLRKRLEAIHAY